MTKFINIGLDEPMPIKFLVKHILYTSIWILGISTLIFRIDFGLKNYLPQNYGWILQIVPFFFIMVVLIIMFSTKWYYNLVLIFYPLMIIFWFLPKIILNKGKIYLFSNYISFIFKRLKNFKKSLLQLFIFILTLLILIISNSNIVRIYTMIIMTFYYYNFLINYVKSSFHPAQLFGESIEKSIDEFLQSPVKKLSLINSIEENNKKDEKLTDEEKKMKKLKTLITFKFLIETFGDNLRGFKGKKAFVISWLYQLVGFLLISLTYFTFLNFELFVVDKSNYTIIGNPQLFDFIYYSIKTITYNNTQNIIPFSPLAKIIETFTFFTLGVFVLVFVTSVVFTLRQDKINENVKMATDLCLYQNQAIIEHIKINYQTDINTVINEAENIKTSLEDLKKAIGKLF